MMSLRHIVIFFSATLLLLPAPGAAQCGGWGPWAAPAAPSHRGITPQRKGIGQRLGNTLINAYQQYVSRAIGARCRMEPSCSRYGAQAISRHGLLLGAVMICDRLIHEVQRQQIAPIVETAHGLRYSDPLEENDFWFSHEKNH